MLQDNQVSQLILEQSRWVNSRYANWCRAGYSISTFRSSLWYIKLQTMCNGQNSGYSRCDFRLHGKEWCSSGFWWFLTTFQRVQAIAIAIYIKNICTPLGVSLQLFNPDHPCIVTACVEERLGKLHRASKRGARRGNWNMGKIFLTLKIACQNSCMIEFGVVNHMHLILAS